VDKQDFDSQKVIRSIYIYIMVTSSSSMTEETILSEMILAGVHYHDDDHDRGVPVIDLAPLLEEHDEIDSSSHDSVVAAIAQACANPGFFQVINHGISPTLIDDYRTQCRLYFQLDRDTKLSMKRHAGNARGYFDDELTKQKRDWKECLDMGVPGNGLSSPQCWNLLPDDAPENECLDGCNQLPDTTVLPDYRRVAFEYFDACAKLSQRLALVMAQGLGKNLQNDPFIVDLETRHTSYLRSNYYPPCPEISDQEDQSPLGISPHKDAGFLTVLLQDDDCHSLQVLRRNKGSNNTDCHGKTNNNNDVVERWITVHPLPGALTINTGDMAQVWSNNKYQAPLHRVLANRDKVRYSAPFFYNPGYQTMVQPATTVVPTADHRSDDNGKMMNHPQYHGILWGYFRAIRFAGDLTDLGVEIQISDFSKNSSSGQQEEVEEEDGTSSNNNNNSNGKCEESSSAAANVTTSSSPCSRHLIYQKVFQERGLTNRAFNVDEYREILKEIDGDT
jgi:isopenicillin N synthase-like dioxygenase